MENFSSFLLWRGDIKTLKLFLLSRFARNDRSCHLTKTFFYEKILTYDLVIFSSVQFSHSVGSNSQQPNEPQHARSPCPSPTPRVYSNSCPLSHLILCRPPLLLPSIFPSIKVFSNESTLHMRWPMYWSFSFSISPSNEYSGLVSFRMDWLYRFAVLGILKSLLQHHSHEVAKVFEFQLQHQSFQWIFRTGLL